MIHCMITTPAVLILGAGASMPFGYPSGSGLHELVCTAIEENQTQDPFFYYMKMAGFDDTNVRKFGHALRRGGASVDAFLEARDEFHKVGKAAMGYFLAQVENEDKLFAKMGSGDKGNWYWSLANAIDAYFYELQDNKLTIVTFNYDRSLEHFLFTHLKEKFKEDDAAVANQLKGLGFIHLHGQLGALPWQDREEPKREYGCVNDNDVAESAKGIQIISEAQEEGPDFEAAWAAIGNAHRIYFLGFGYHSTNLERLRLSAARNGASIAGTIMGLTAYEIAKVRMQIRECLTSRAKQASIEVNLVGDGCFNFFRRQEGRLD